MFRIAYQIIKPFCIVALVLLAKPSQSQYLIKEADRKALVYDYSKAITLYKKAFKRKPTVAAARGAAEGYRRTKDYVFAESWYAKLTALKDHTAEDKFHYAEMLMNNSKYAEAHNMLDQYLQQKPGDAVAQNMLKGCDNAARWMAQPRRGDLRNMNSLNSRWSDWGTAFNDNKIVFASDRPYDSLGAGHFFRNSNIKKRAYTWTGNSYLHLYASGGKDSNDTKLLERNINGDFHSASASYSDQNNAMYYAVTTLQKKKRSFLGKDDPYTLNIEILEYKKDTTGRWKRAAAFPYNAIFNYSVGDPWITADGKRLYFTADFPGKGYGGTDIYYADIKADGTWSDPVNMGDEINTAADERTPFFNKEGLFYFASDGRPGMGGLDIYTASKKEQWKIENAGSPVNSAQDDFAPAFTAGCEFYFSSNRLGGKGSDDIYCFDPARNLIIALTGKALDSKTKEPLANVVVTLESKSTGTPVKVITDAEGNYRFQLDSVTDYNITVNKTDYATVTSIPVTTKGVQESLELKKNILLDKIELNKPWKVENIYFDLDKSNIRPDAAAELDKLVKLLNDNPTWEVEMGSHTDSRANDAYNVKLSQRRAESTVAYLISKGVSKERLTAKGYGESKLLNECDNDAECSEEAHQQNRRTEFIVLDK